MRALLRTFSWQELRHHPWRNAAAVVAVMLGVALAFSVHLINASALSEFSQAVRSVNGQPDLELRAVQNSFDEAIYGRVAAQPQVALASPVLEISTYALDDKGQRQALRIMGVDALVVAAITPALMPRPTSGVAVPTALRCLRPARFLSTRPPARRLVPASCNSRAVWPCAASR